MRVVLEAGGCTQWIGLADQQALAVICLLPIDAIRRSQRHHMVVRVVLHLDRRAIGAGQADQVAMRIIGKRRAQPLGICHRHGPPEIVVLEQRHAIERIDLAQRQLVLIELDHAQVPQRVGHPGLAQ